MKRWITVAALFAGCSAFGGVVTYSVSLSGSAESPPNGSLATGVGTVTIDTTAHQLMVSFVFSGVTSGTTASHIHCCTTVPFIGAAGVATQLPFFVGFPTGVTSGSYSNTFDDTQASTWNPSFVTANGGTPLGAEAALAAGAAAGEAYLNIHSNTFPGGELRGFLLPVPEPGTLALMAVGAILAAFRRKRA